MIFGLLGFAKSSLPGDPLYIIRKVAHLGQAILTPEAEKSAYQLELANERLEDLANAPAKNLAPTINEFQANISQAAKELSKVDATTSSPTIIKKIVQEAKKIKENKQKAESLGVVIDGTEKLDSAL
jgi:PHD/YefM family antitoxin component YafN of YafNO toxin-antitoxin module